jgi:hypothetical protein
MRDHEVCRAIAFVLIFPIALKQSPSLRRSSDNLCLYTRGIQIPHTGQWRDSVRMALAISHSFVRKPSLLARDFLVGVILSYGICPYSLAGNANKCFHILMITIDA